MKNNVLNFNELERRGMTVIDIDTELGLVLSILKSEDEGCSRNRRDKFGDCSNCTSNDCMGCKYYG